MIARLRLRAERDVEVIFSIMIERYGGVMDQSAADRSVTEYNDLAVCQIIYLTISL